ncbi:MAG: transposase [Candidatus Obscuribacter sp.]|nr:transposase [Candidatus Obscuribacter sp.]MBK9276575.1 transposase [Candidatus Obscuribacter sp.]
MLSFPRSTVYEGLERERNPHAGAKRGPKPVVSDEFLLDAIRKEIESSPSAGEGHRKVWQRLRFEAGIVVGRNRVLKLMRLHGLLLSR